MGCVPNSSIACACPDGSNGAQTCTPDGLGYSVCSCGNDGGTAGDESGADTAEDEDTGGMDQGADDTTGGVVCGDGVEGPGECDEDSDVYCPDDCPFGVTGDTGGSSDGVNSCDDMPIYALSIPNVASAWEHNGAVGFAAGNAMCQDMGGDHVCDYEEVVAAAAKNEFAALPAGSTAWLHRTVNVMDGGVMYAPGVGGRCQDWIYSTNHIADGEYVTFNAGVPAYTFDNDTNFNAAAPAPNPHVQMGLLECGGTMRSILCCHPECMPEG